jgi:hypothetical protein
MRKKILSVIAVVAVAAVAGYNVYTAQKSDVVLSDIALANVEALAEDEWGLYNCFWDSSSFWFCTRWGTYLGCPCYM